ncbi:MAG: hypothetical protein WC505_05440 [Patescibacteria group bacterium]
MNVAEARRRIAELSITVTHGKITSTLTDSEIKQVERVIQLFRDAIERAVLQEADGLLAAIDSVSGVTAKVKAPNFAAMTSCT